MEYWSGRVDGNDSDILRIHQVIQVKTLDELMQDEYNGKKVCFVSYNSNEGLRMHFLISLSLTQILNSMI